MRIKKAGLDVSGRVSRHRVRDGLREMILSGRYPPGSKLPQMRLAKQFGVAQGVIRESLLELKACGLVETVDHLGVFVSNLDAEKLVQAYEIREVLEGLAARLCCQRANREDLSVLREMARQIHRLASGGRKGQMGSLDRAFHHRMIQISGNQMLERLTESYRVLGKILRVDRSVRVVRDEHLGILKAIERNQPDEAERRMREHIRAAKRIVEEQVKAGEFVPHWVL